MIAIRVATELFENDETISVEWIRSNENIVDCVTHRKRIYALKKLLMAVIKKVEM